LRVIEAISSIDAEVSSSDAACSVAPCDSDCDDVATWLAADTTCSEPCFSSAAVLRSRRLTEWTTQPTRPATERPMVSSASPVQLARS
jgi:hypothetical protein